MKGAKLKNMRLKDILTPSMKSVRREYDPRPLWQRRLSADSEFCRAVVAAGYLTREQMLRAVQRYRLGCSRDGGVIFWQIDQMGLIWDGKIMYYRPDCHRDHSRHPNWVSHLLKVHYGCQHLDIPTVHCLFGQHLLKGLSDSQTVCVVEAEKTAVILSETVPDCVWLATGGLNELSTIKLFPLRHYRVVLFPDTDEHHQAYSLWYETAQKARRDYGVHCFVSPILERRATTEQKARKIDLVDWASPGPFFASKASQAPSAEGGEKSEG